MSNKVFEFIYIIFIYLNVYNKHKKISNGVSTIMVDGEIIVKILKKYMNYLKDKFFIDKIGVFGSYIRDEQTPKSDIDIFVEFNGPVGWKFFTLKEFLEEKLGKKIDLVTENSLRDEMKDDVLKEVIYI